MRNNIFNVAEAKKHFSDILGRVAYGNETIIITRRGKPMAKLIPVDRVEEEDHLSKAKGWLDDGDDFFEVIDKIVQARANHLPRLMKDKRK